MVELSGFHFENCRGWSHTVEFNENKEIIASHFKRFQNNNFKKAITCWSKMHNYCIGCQLTTFLVALQTNDVVAE